MTAGEGDLPQDRRQDLKKAVRLAWWSLAYLVSGATLVVLVMGRSQALKTELTGELLSMIPPILFLVGGRVAARKPSQDFPYGFSRGVSAGYLGASVALLGVGLFLLLDGASKLLQQEHPTLGGVSLFGHVIWLGWLALPVLAWSAIPAYFLGKAKLKLSERLHDKVLMADAKINKADWQSAGAAALGIIGLSFGLWWADAGAAVVISFEIIRDGLSNMSSAASDLMNRRPQRLTSQERDPLPETLSAFLRSKPWVADAVVRIREEGRSLLADAYVATKDDTDLVRDIAEAAREGCEMDWRLRELIIMPVEKISQELARVRADA